MKNNKHKHKLNKFIFMSYCDCGIGKNMDGAVLLKRLEELKLGVSDNEVGKAFIDGRNSGLDIIIKEFFK